MKVQMKGRIKALSVNEEDIFLDDTDIYVSPIKSSIKIKMKARMKGRVKPLAVDEEEIIDIYE